MPNSSERFSSNPPATAPSMLAPNAALGDSANLNSEENKTPANMTGTEKTNTAITPPSVGEPMRSNGNQYAKPRPAIRAAQVHSLDGGFARRSTIQLAINSAISKAEMTIPFTCQ